MSILSLNINVYFRDESMTNLTPRLRIRFGWKARKKCIISIII